MQKHDRSSAPELPIALRGQLPPSSASAPHPHRLPGRGAFCQRTPSDQAAHNAHAASPRQPARYGRAFCSGLPVVRVREIGRYGAALPD
jgi:hypothetical protein